jgi:hypothetical protein
MPCGTRHTETGVLMRHPGFGYVLETGGGGFWILESMPWRSKRWLGKRITVEGVRVDFNALAVKRVAQV